MERLATLLVLLLVFLRSTQAQTDLCPSAAAIAPCDCEVTEGRPGILCTQINDEQELERIFSVKFPVTDMQIFTLQSSFLTGITRNVFGNVSFENIIIETDYLSEISETAFVNSLNTLAILVINGCPITSTTFPFASLENFASLLEVRITGNLIEEFPTIMSASIRLLYITSNPLMNTIPARALAGVPEVIDLDLSSCGIQIVAEDAFAGIDLLQYLSLSNNIIGEIGPSIFANLTELVNVNLAYNNISYIEPATFRELPMLREVNLNYNDIEEVHVSTFYMCSNLETVRARNNRITYIQPGSFNTNTALRLVDLSFNNMTRLVSGTFTGLTHADIYLDDNIINNIQEYCFGNIEDSAFNLQHNNITNLDEYWLSLLLQRNNEVNLIGNAITCGCEIAWIFEDPTFQTLLIAECPDGQLISELDPEYFQDFC